MAFLIPDNLKSRKDVKAGFRLVAEAFQVGLDEDVIVWYEPLYDPTGEKPHFVVLLPNNGVVILEVLEVKTAGLLGALRGRFRLERDGREVEVENPLNRAERLAKTLRKRISEEPRMEGINVSVAAGAIFSSMDESEVQEKGLGDVLPLARCLFKPDLEAARSGQGEDKLLRPFLRILGGGQREPILEKEVKVLRGLIQPEIVIDRIGKDSEVHQLTIFRPPEGEGDFIRVMDRKQEAMAKSLGEGHRVIRGVAGSGKTLILVYRARLLARLFPQNRFLVTCYTRSLAGQLRDLLSDHSNIDVIHLDKLMANLIRAASLRHPGYSDNSGDDVAKVALQAVKGGAGNRYRAIFLDEAQDFGTDALKLVVGLVQPEYQDLVIVADAAQNIFKRKFSWKQAGIQAQGRTRILKVNYRNTREILEFASRFLFSSLSLHGDAVPNPEDENAVIPPESAVRNGPNPSVEVKGNVMSEIDAVIDQTLRWSGQSPPARHIAVLYGSSYSGGVDRAKILNQKMQERGLGVYWLSDPQNKSARDQLAQVNSPIILSTIHSAKGLEFPLVVLCGIWREQEETEKNRMLTYVGMTRATNQLALITTEDNPMVGDIRKAQQG